MMSVDDVETAGAWVARKERKRTTQRKKIKARELESRNNGKIKNYDDAGGISSFVVCHSSYLIQESAIGFTTKRSRCALLSGSRF